MDIVSYALGKKAGGGGGGPQYIDLSYIESTGTQHIDTGITPDETTKIEVQFQETIKYGSWPKVFGSEIGHDNMSFKMDLRNSIYYDYIDTEYSFSNSEVSPFDIPHLTSLERGLIKYDNKTKTFSEARQWSNDYNIYLFACNRSGSAIENGALKMFYCKIWKNGELVRDYIPKYSVDDKENGLFDRVSQTFFKSAGSGKF